MKKNSKAMEFTLREAGEYFDDHDIFEAGDVVEVKDFATEKLVQRPAASC